MNDSLYQMIFSEISCGILLHELIYDASGNPHDMRILSVNPCFEDLSGISGPDIVNKKFTDVQKKAGEYLFRPLAFYNGLLEKGGSEEYEAFLEKNQKWCSIKVFPVQEKIFVTIINDITELKQSIANEEELLNLSRILVDTGGIELDYDNLTNVLRKLSGAAYGVLNLYSDDGLKFRNIAVSGNHDLIIRSVNYLGYNLKNKEWNISEARLKVIKGGNPVRFESIYALASEVVPETLCNTISKAFNIGSVYVVEIAADKGVSMGDFILLFEKGHELLNPSSVSAYANMVGIAIARRKTEEDIQKSENNLDNFFNAGIDFHWVLDQSGCILAVNQTVRKRLGFTEGELLGKSVLSVHPPEFHKEAGEVMASMLNGSDIPCFIPLITKSGFHIPVETYVVRGEWNGSPALFGVSRDISELKISENELLKAKEILEETGRLARVGSWEVDFLNNTVYWSDITKEIAEVPMDYIPDINSVANFYKEGRDRERILEIIETASQRFESFDEEFRVITGTGREIWIRNIIKPAVTAGKCVHLFGTIQDINERKSAEIRLQYQSDLRKLLVELSSGFINLPINEIEPAISKSLSKIGEFVGADRAYIFDYDFTGNTYSSRIEWCRDGIEHHFDDLKNLSLDIYPEFVELHRLGEPYIVECVKEMPESEFRNHLRQLNIKSILSVPLISNGDCRGFIGFDSVREMHTYNQYEEQLLQVYAQTLVNVMERLEKEKNLISAKEKAEESDRLKSAFLANMSHEIRTPMNGIIGFLSLLREPDLSDENKAAYINIVTMSGQRLLDTINDIIEISRIETGELNINYSDINISELVGYYKGFFTHQAEKKGLQLYVSEKLPENVRYFRSDRNKLDSIVSNLMKNAIKFTTSGSVELGCTLEANNLLFYVNDTGIGIPAEKKDRIFERFVQVDVSTSRQHEGSGLGLAIVKGYIDLLEGHIQVDSTVGKGTRIVFSIPYLAATQGKSLSTDSADEDKPLKRGIKILIAEDDYASYLYLHKALADTAISIVRTLSGEDTVKCVQEDPSISAVLMDIKLTGMSGLEATRRIREFNSSIPIIAQTAYSLYGDRELAINSGCTDYISKPVDRQELKRLLKKYT